jgi:hypothetical protein
MILGLITQMGYTLNQWKSFWMLKMFFWGKQKSPCVFLFLNLKEDWLSVGGSGQLKSNTRGKPYQLSVLHLWIAINIANESELWMQFHSGVKCLDDE